MTIEILLEKLHGVRKVGDGRWVACCPAHDDRAPSLSLCETADGVTLLKCFAGCNATEVVNAVGLTLSDLFPRLDAFGQRRPQKRPWTAAQLLHVVNKETLIVFVLACDVIASGNLVQTDLDKLAQARRRIAAVIGELP